MLHKFNNVMDIYYEQTSIKHRPDEALAGAWVRYKQSKYVLCGRRQ